MCFLLNVLKHFEPKGVRVTIGSRAYFMVLCYHQNGSNQVGNYYFPKKLYLE